MVGKEASKFLSIEGLLSARPAEKVTGGGVIPLGTSISGWRVVAFVGKGRSAEVYRVVNSAMGGEAALKLLTDGSRGLSERFRLEMDVVRTLPLQSLPRFFGDGVFEGRPYYLMEYLQPLILPLPRREIVPFVSALARAVGDLHSAGYLHRDLKPANVLRRRNGEPVLIDLGLVKRIGGSETAVHEPSGVSYIDGRRVVVGTPGFAAPEQLISGEASFRSDVFALGEMLKACGGKDLGHAARRVIRFATMADPEERYPDAATFESAVRGLERSPRGMLLSASAAFAAAVLAFALFRTMEGPQPPPPGPPEPSAPAQESAAISLTRQPGESDEAHLRRLVAEAEKGSAAAQCAAAEAYYHGRGAPTNHFEAVRLYRLAAEKDYTGAQVSLGNCLLRGIGCDKDQDEAVIWLLKAANNGNLGAMVDLAFCFRNGIGVDKDMKEAFDWAMKAAESGHAAAQTFIGECYLEGYGVPVDQRRADDWLQRAARQGNERAKMLLRTR